MYKCITTLNPKPYRPVGRLGPGCLSPRRPALEALYIYIYILIGMYIYLSIYLSLSLSIYIYIYIYIYGAPDPQGAAPG